MLDLSSLDLEDIANALADQNGYEHLLGILRQPLPRQHHQTAEQAAYKSSHPTTTRH